MSWDEWEIIWVEGKGKDTQPHIHTEFHEPSAPLTWDFFQMMLLQLFSRVKASNSAPLSCSRDTMFHRALLWVLASELGEFYRALQSFCLLTWKLQSLFLVGDNETCFEVWLGKWCSASSLVLGWQMFASSPCISSSVSQCTELLNLWFYVLSMPHTVFPNSTGTALLNRF